MYGTSLECGIKSVKVKATEVAGRWVRRCRVTLAHEFTHDIARELGEDAVALRVGLTSFSIEKAVLPIENLSALGALSVPNGGGGVSIERMYGVKATCIAAKKDGEGPTIQLEFEFPWQEDAWVFLGRHCNAVADVVLTKSQLALATSAEAN